jgi:hypothetical protein
LDGRVLCWGCFGLLARLSAASCDAVCRLVPCTAPDLQMYAHIREQVSHGGKVFIVCPLVESSLAEGMQEVKAAEEEWQRLKVRWRWKQTWWQTDGQTDRQGLEAKEHHYRRHTAGRGTFGRGWTLLPGRW